MTTAERSDRFAEDLISKGYRKFTNAPGLVGRRFAITYRSVKPSSWLVNRRYEVNWSPKGVFSGGGGEWGSVNRVDAIDLFELIYIDDELVYLPVGNRNYSIAEFGDQAIANGNKAKRVEELSKRWILSPNKYFNPFELVDRIFDFDGLRVAERRRLLQDISLEFPDPKLVKRIEYLYPNEPEPWQGHGLGKLLASLGIEVLRQTGVTEIDYMGRLNNISRHIMNKLGYKGSLRQKIDEYDRSKTQEFLKLFVLSSHD